MSDGVSNCKVSLGSWRVRNKNQVGSVATSAAWLSYELCSDPSRLEKDRGSEVEAAATIDNNEAEATITGRSSASLRRD